MENQVPTRLTPLDPVPRLNDDFQSLSKAKEGRAWALGALAELVDSALLRSKDDVHIDCSIVQVGEDSVFELTIQDNGAGLSLDEIVSLCSLGKTDASNVGRDQAGQGGCAGAILRLANETLILSKTTVGVEGTASSSHVALFSPALFLTPQLSAFSSGNRPLLPLVHVEPSGAVLEGGKAGA